MKPTLEQLEMLSDYERNCAVAEKLGFTVKERYKDTGVIILDIIHDGKHVVRPADYCNVPNDYMPIAIEHGIDIVFDSYCRTKERFVQAQWNMGDNSTAPLGVEQTGRAVCIAFLLMEIE